jgi:hypothetical protein
VRKGLEPEEAGKWLTIGNGVVLIACKMRVKLPADVAIDPKVDLWTGSDGYFLQSVP